MEHVSLLLFVGKRSREFAKMSKGALFWKFSFKISRFSKCDWKCLPIFVLLKCLSYFPWTAKGPFTWSRSLLPPSWIAENFDENVNIKKYKLLNLNYVCFVGLAATFTACIFQSCKSTIQEYTGNAKISDTSQDFIQESQYQQSYIALSDIENKISKGIKNLTFQT